MKNQTRDAYRRAAVKLFGVTAEEAAVYIKSAEDDRGEWAPGAQAIIYLEADCRTEGDTGTLPDHLDFYSSTGMENCFKLDREARAGCYIEYINAAVAAVWRD